MRIFLVGYMGVGKTTLGKSIAKSLGYAFVDTDTMVSALEAMPIKDIFASKGEAYFREKEQACLHRLNKRTDLVVATGGGLPCFFDNMDWMNTNGHTVYLYLSPEGLFARLKNDKEERPLISNLSDEDLYNFINQSLLERNHFYMKSRTVFEVNDNDVSSLVELLKLSDNP